MAGTESSHSTEDHLIRARVEGRRLVIRADATVQMGTGHIMRCLALAQARQDFGGSVIFASHDLDSGPRNRLNQEGFDPAGLNAPVGSNDGAAETAALASQLGYDLNLGTK